jgi:hypothetical protein
MHANTSKQNKVLLNWGFNALDSSKGINKKYLSKNIVPAMISKLGQRMSFRKYIFKI